MVVGLFVGLSGFVCLRIVWCSCCLGGLGLVSGSLCWQGCFVHGDS